MCGFWTATDNKIFIIAVELLLSTPKVESVVNKVSFLTVLKTKV